MCPSRWKRNSCRHFTGVSWSYLFVFKQFSHWHVKHIWVTRTSYSVSLPILSFSLSFFLSFFLFLSLSLSLIFYLWCLRFTLLFVSVCFPFHECLSFRKQSLMCFASPFVPHTTSWMMLMLMLLLVWCHFFFFLFFSHSLAFLFLPSLICIFLLPHNSLLVVSCEAKAN